MKTFFNKYNWATYGRKESALELWKKCEEQKSRVPLFKKAFKFSFIIKSTAHVDDCLATIESFLAQSYPHWQLIVNAAPGDSRFKSIKDKRVIVIQSGLGEVSKLISGDYSGVIDAGNILNPSVLFHFALTLEKKESDLLYCNQVLMENGKERLFSKPEFSYISILNQNYIDKLWIAKTSLYLAEQQENEHLFFIHNARVDSNWELVPVYGVLCEAKKTLPISDEYFNEALSAVNLSGTTCHAIRNETGWNILPDSSVAVQSMVSVVICFKDKANWTEKCLENLTKFVGNVIVEVILVNNNSKSSELIKLKNYLSDYTLRYVLVDYPHAFNFGHMHNWAIENYASGDYILLLNNDVFLKADNRLKDMLGWAALPYIGTVGCLLRYKDGRIQHAGLTAQIGGESRLARVGNEQSNEKIWKNTREVFGNTFAACLMKKTTFKSIGGFRELDLANGFGDVAFNLECQRAGLKNVNLGYIEGLHLESASRGHSYEYWEECILEQEYPDLLQRMVRYDFGFNRMPVSSSSFRDLMNYTKGKVRQNFPWLKDVKSKLIQMKSSVKDLQENFKT